MQYLEFSESIRRISKHPLPGFDAHNKLVPGYRQQILKKYNGNANTKKAAVLALFYPDMEGNTRLLLTLRASYKGTHSAQISFPGGKTEGHDNNLAATALRETYEEVGIPTTTIQMVRELTNVYIPPSNFLVTPFIGITDSTPIFKTNHEVESLVEVLLSDLLDDQFIRFKTTDEITGTETKIPYYNFNNRMVWGATAMIISEIKELIKTT